MKLKRIAAIHDISGIGKCSLTAALPVISASGIEAAAFPTAVLSTHTGNIEGFTYRDLTGDMPSYASHWKSLGVEFDGIYSGFLGSTEQVEIVKDFIDMFRREGTVVLVDPAMADGGEMYKTFKPGFAEEMKSLCGKADIIVPNITEAAFLTDSECDLHGDKEYIEKLLSALSGTGAKMTVLTGVSFSENEIGCAVRSGNRTEYFFTERFDGVYYGTGDLFASALFGAYINGINIFRSAQIALEFVCSAIRRTYEAGTDTRLGVDFEHGLKDYINRLEEKI